MKDNEIDELEAMQLEMKAELQEEVDEILKKAQTEDLSVEDYYNLYSNYEMLQENSEYKEQIEKYKELIKQKVLNSSQNPSANDYECLGYVYFDEKNYDKAFEYIDKAINLDPTNGGLHYTKGRFYSRIKRKDYAEVEYSKAIELDPELKEVIELTDDTDKLTSNENRLLVLYCVIFAIFIVYSIYQIIKSLF